MRMVDLFSGIGGFAYAAREVWKEELEIINFVEIDSFCKKVLNKNFPGVIVEGNIKKYHAGGIGPVDLITGGDPCQPNSQAGRRLGTADDRYLWPEMFRIIIEARPSWVINENVVGSATNMVLDKKVSDLESFGYQVSVFDIPASGLNFWHQRRRIWVVANSGRKYGAREEIKGQFIDENKKKNAIKLERSAGCYGLRNITDTKCARLEKWEEATGIHESLLQTKRGNDESWIQVATELCRVDDGVSNRVDRLKGLGNAIVPQVAMVIMSAIKTIEEEFVDEQI